MAFDVSFIYRIQDRYTPQLRKIQAATARFGRKLGDVSARGLKGLARGMNSVIVKGAAFAGALGLGSVALSANAYSKSADKLAKLSKAVGESGNTLAGWQHAAELSGLSAGQMDKAVLRLFRNVGDFKNGTGELATLLKNSPIFAGTLKDASSLEEQFYLVVDALQGIEDPAQQAAAAAKFFGERVGPQMIPLLSEGTEGIRKMAGEWKRLHGGFDAEQLAAAELYQDELGRLQLTLIGLRDAIGGAVLPIMTEWITKLKEWILEGRESGDLVETIKGHFERFIETVKNIPWRDIKDGAKEVGLAIWNIAGFINMVVEKIGGWKNATIGLIGYILASPIVKFLATVAGAVFKVAKPMMGIFGRIALGIAALFGLKAIIIGAIGAAIAGAAWLIFKNWDKVKEYFWSFVDWFGSVFDGIGDKIANVFSSVGSFFGFGGGAPAPEQAALPTAANPSPLSDGKIAVAVAIAGTIGIDITGPGKVRDATISSNPPGNLGFNLGMAGAG